jgi:CRP-like cAMP-binding protein
VQLFSNCDPEFQSDLFPYLKPVSFSAGDVIFRKGERSRELLFLLRGEVSQPEL